MANKKKSTQAGISMEKANAQLIALEKLQKEQKCAASLETSKDRPIPDSTSTTEAVIGKIIDAFFPDGKEDGRGKEDLKKVLGRQLTYYDQQINLYKTQCDQIRKDLNEAERHVRLIETETAHVVASTGTEVEVRKAIGTVRAAVKECAGKVRGLEKTIPVLLEPEGSGGEDRADSLEATPSRLLAKGNLLGINHLVHDLTQSVHIIINAIPSANQRIAERDFEIARLENQIRRARGSSSSHTMEPNTDIRTVELSPEDVDRIEYHLGAILDQIPRVAKAYATESKWEKLLPEMEEKYPNDTGGLIASIKDRISRASADKRDGKRLIDESMEQLNWVWDVIRGDKDPNMFDRTTELKSRNAWLEDRTARLEDRVAKLQAKNDDLETTNADHDTRHGALKDRYNALEDELATGLIHILEHESALGVALYSCQPTHPSHIRKYYTLSTEDMRAEVKIAKEKNKQHVEEVKKLKRECAEKVKDLEARLAACMPPSSSHSFIVIRILTSRNRSS